MTIRYRIVPKHPEAHLFEVSCTVAAPDPQGQRFALPAWIPGSYMIREFAKHVVSIRAESGGRRVAIGKLDKHTWQAAPAKGALTVTMEVYAWDLSVRGAHLDTTHGFFNGPCVFLRVLGREDERCEVEILPPAGRGYREWKVATALAPAGAKLYGFGKYAADDYDELIDHPVEMGTFALTTFRAAGVPHDIAITGRHDADLERLGRDLRVLCETEMRFWHGPRVGKAGGPRPPMKRYVFFVMAVGDGYGGLEHRASTALLCARDDLPRAGDTGVNESYRRFLGLVSHEYFHTWNVKRLKPAVFAPYDLEHENYTTLLWAFEGITSYYDDLLLRRSGLIDDESYLELLGRAITSHLRTPGRKRQTVAEASWDAWIKYYRQDENSPNALVSYYLEGSLVALALDLLIRTRTHGRRSLDDVMRALWKKFGTTGIGVPETALEEIAQAVTGLRLKSFFDSALRSTEELPLKRLLAAVGIDMQVRAAESSSDAGGKVASGDGARKPARVVLGARMSGENEAKLTNVFDGGPAQIAGLAAGDAIVAVDGLRVNGKTLDARLARRTPGATVKVHAFRRDELMTFDMKLAAAPADTCALAVKGRAGGMSRLRARWLKGR